jgi:hypothetical protein
VQEGRSVPAPGQGILTTAREVRGAKPSQLLDISYRRRQLQFQQKQTKVRLALIVLDSRRQL